VSVIEKYKNIRKVGRELAYKILEACVTKEVLTHSSKLLGINVQGNELFFDSEEETSLLMDFVLFDYKVNGKNAVQLYREKQPDHNKVEDEIIGAMLSSYTSLFEVSATTDYIVYLKDLFSRTDKPIELIDIGFSGTATPGTLTFFRLVPVTGCNMTSGVSFVFRNELKEYLVKRYLKISKKIETGDDNMKRYISFFKLNKECGEEIRHIG
jgi:hypothetical protein